MLLFRRKREKDQRTPAWYKGVSRQCSIYGHRVSDYLQNKTSRLSLFRLKVLWLLFILLAGGGSGWVIMNALSDPSPIIRVAPISPPARLPSTSGGPLPDDPLTQAFLERIQLFRERLDSLKNDPQGRLFYDSFQQARPGLFDSLRQLEQYYRLPPFHQR